MGHVVGIWVAPDAKAPMVAVDEAKAVAGEGIEGDRYALKRGSYSARPGSGREVTLVEQESIDAIRAENGIELAPGATRRNVVTTGIALNHLVGREFTVGGARLRGTRLCEPCEDLARLVGQPIVTPLLHRAGLRAEIVEGGVIRTGDSVSSTPSPERQRKPSARPS